MSKTELSNALHNEDPEKVYGGAGTVQDGFDKKFTLILRDTGHSKMSVIAMVKEMKGMTLTEAKAFVDTLPRILAENMTEKQALADRSRLESVGATVDLL